MHDFLKIFPTPKIRPNTNGQQDVRYLTRHISSIAEEDAERQKWNTVHVKKN